MTRSFSCGYQALRDGEEAEGRTQEQWTKDKERTSRAQAPAQCSFRHFRCPFMGRMEQPPWPQLTSPSVRLGLLLQTPSWASPGATQPPGSCTPTPGDGAHPRMGGISILTRVWGWEGGQLPGDPLFPGGICPLFRATQPGRRAEAFPVVQKSPPPGARWARVRESDAPRSSGASPS